MYFCLRVVALSLLASMAGAQATRTWVSGVGDDANPCSRTAPCKTFAGAISKTATSGEIDALDPGGFGAVTITKSITIDGGTGNIGGITAPSSTAINVNAPANAIVSIRNLDIDGIGSGVTGINFIAGGVLHVEHCVIFGFTNGIKIASNAGAQVSIVDDIVRDNTQNGLLVQNTIANAFVLVSGSHFNNNALNGILAADFSRVTVRNSEASANANVGYLANAADGMSTLNLIDSTAANNAAAGVQAGGGAAPSAIRITGVSIFGHTIGLSTLANGSITSFGNNYNASVGTPNGSIAPQ